MLDTSHPSLNFWTIDTRNYPRIGNIHRHHPALDRLIPHNAAIEVLAGGFYWTEGPIWVRDGEYLLFSDIPRNATLRWKEGEGVSIFLQPSGYTGPGNYGKEPGANGMTLDARGQLVCCEHGDRRLSVLTQGGGKRTLTDSYQGRRFNSPNDCVYKSNGDLYFTDPAYGLPEQFEDPRRELDFCGVYRYGRDGVTTLLTAELSRPNGLAFSPDERILYVSNSDPERAVWMQYSVQPNGTIADGRVFYDATPNVSALPGLPDGFKLDIEGNIFATGPGGVYVFNPSGELLGRLETGEATSNCAWGDDGSSLFICSDMYLLRIRTSTRGQLC
jgi:gluconolactonase